MDIEIIDITTQNWCGYNVRFVKYCGTWYAVLKDICDALDLNTYNIAYRIDANNIRKLSIKTGGYIRGNYFAFVVTDLSDDNRIYEVTSLTNPKSIAVTSYIQENTDPFFV